MIWVNIIAVIILFFSLVGGLKEGAVKQFFNLLVLIIAIPLAGLFCSFIATVFSFLPGTNWENFFGFFITLALISVIFHIIFFVPNRITRKIWKKGLLFRVFGGAFNLLNASIGLVVLTLVLATYPILDWLERVVTNASVPVWLVDHLAFVQAMLPEVFHKTASLVSALSLCHIDLIM